MIELLLDVLHGPDFLNPFRHDRDVRDFPIFLLDTSVCLQKLIVVIAKGAFGSPLKILHDVVGIRRSLCSHSKDGGN